MGRIRRTIIMGNPRGFVLKTFALIIFRVFGLSMPIQESRRADLRTAYPCSSYE